MGGGGGGEQDDEEELWEQKNGSGEKIMVKESKRENGKETK